LVWNQIIIPRTAIKCSTSLITPPFYHLECAFLTHSMWGCLGPITGSLALLPNYDHPELNIKLDRCLISHKKHWSMLDLLDSGIKHYKQRRYFCFLSERQNREIIQIFSNLIWETLQCNVVLHRHLAAVCAVSNFTVIKRLSSESCVYKTRPGVHVYFCLSAWCTPYRMIIAVTTILFSSIYIDCCCHLANEDPSYHYVSNVSEAASPSRRCYLANNHSVIWLSWYFSLAVMMSSC
jgi:hypothetical protein